MKPVYLATFETPNFTFQVIGATDHQARQALFLDWPAHVKSTGADRDYLKENMDSIVVTRMLPSVTYCDGLSLR